MGIFDGTPYSFHRACYTRGSYDAKRNRTWSLSEPRRQLGPLAAFEVVLPRARTACEDRGRGTTGRSPKAYFNPSRRNDLRVAWAEYKIALSLWSFVTVIFNFLTKLQSIKNSTHWTVEIKIHVGNFGQKHFGWSDCFGGKFRTRKHENTSFDLISEL